MSHQIMTGRTTPRSAAARWLSWRLTLVTALICGPSLLTAVAQESLKRGDDQSRELLFDPCSEVLVSAAESARHYYAGQHAAAEAAHRRAMEQLQRLEPLQTISCAISAQWEFRVGERDYPSYITQFSELGLEAALRSGQFEAAGTHLGQMANIHWSVNQFPEAMRAFLRFGAFAEPFTRIRLDAPRGEMIRETLVFKDFLRRFVRFMYNTHTVRPALCKEHRCLDLAWEMAEKIKSRLFRSELIRAASYTLSETDRLRVGELLGRERRLRIQQNLSPTSQQAGDIHSAVNDLERLLPSYRELFADPPALSAVKTALESDEILLSFFYTDNGRPVYVTVITRTGEPYVRTLPITTLQLYAAVTNIRERVRAGQSFEELRQTLRSLHERLIAPLSLPRRGRLIVAVDQNLSALPFELLPVSDGELMADRYDIYYVPSASVFYQLRHRDTAKVMPHPRHEYTGFSYKGDGKQQLLHADIELRNAARRFVDGLPVVGANESALYTAAPRVASTRFLHLVTHNRALNDEEGTVYLEFGSDASEDGKLTGLELIRRLPNRAELVVLSGCETVLPNDTFFPGHAVSMDLQASRGSAPQLNVASGCVCSYGESFSNLAGAFFASGSQMLLLTQWPVPDTEETEEFVSSFFQMLRLASHRVLH